MSDFFDNYLNFKKMIESKHEYKEQMARVESLPNDYRFVFKKIQDYMWTFVTGSGYDMLKIQYDLIDLFESGVADGKDVLDITGSDVAAFCDELLRGAETYTENRQEKLNREIMDEVGKTGK